MALIAQESSSFLKKRTKELLIKVSLAASTFLSAARVNMAFFFFSKKKYFLAALKGAAATAEAHVTRLCAFARRSTPLWSGVLWVALDVDQRAPGALAAS